MSDKRALYGIERISRFTGKSVGVGTERVSHAEAVRICDGKNRLHPLFRHYPHYMGRKEQSR